MKLLAWILAATLTPFYPTSFTNQNKVTQRALSASVVLHMKFVRVGSDGITKIGYAGCSGTFVSKYTILTAAHCVSNFNDKVWARGPDEKVGYPVRLVFYDRSKDLALLEAPFKHTYCKLGDMPIRGDVVLNIGSPLGFEFVPSEGIVGMTEYEAPGFKAKYLVTTAMANPGSSGGGAFSTNGSLIGVNTMIIGLFGWSGITLSVNVDTVKLFMAEALKYYNPAEFRP
jgi:serine protease Do